MDRHLATTYGLFTIYEDGSMGFQGEFRPNHVCFAARSDGEKVRDFLIECFPLEAAAQPAEPEKPKITYKVVEQQVVDRYGSYTRKPTVCRVEPTTREITVATFEVQKDADDFAALMNSK